MSVVVLFEAEFVPGSRERYLALAQKLAERARFSVSVDVSQYVLFGFCHVAYRSDTEVR